jgi:hypothetical protein
LVTLKGKDLPLLLRQRFYGRRVCWWEKLPVTRLDSLLLQLRFVCEPASLWARPLVKRLAQAMRRSRLPRLPSRLSYATDVSLAIRQESAIDLAQYKPRRIRLHKAEREFLWSYRRP